MSTPVATCPDASGPINGAIVFGADNNLLAVDVTGGQPMRLTALAADAYAYEPSWSSDGQTLAYTLARPSSDPDLSWLPAGSICGLDRATGKGRLLAQGAGMLDLLTEAVWMPDNMSLLVTLHQPRLDANRQYLGDSTMIGRYDLQAKMFTPLIKDGLSPMLSPDGKRLVYMLPNPADLSMNLWVAASDGQDAQLLRTQPPVRVVTAPRWSPDGQQLAFSASSGEQLGIAETVDPRSWLDTLLGVRVARGHGIPADIWISQADGQKLRRITNHGLDDPHVAWGPDGRQIVYTNGLGGVTILDLATGQEQLLTDLGNYGGISWARQ